MAPVLYICISVFSVSLSARVVFYFCLCKLEVAMIINPAQQRLLFLSAAIWSNHCFAPPGLVIEP